jgi:hypothetical protein
MKSEANVQINIALAFRRDALLDALNDIPEWTMTMKDGVVTAKMGETVYSCQTWGSEPAVCPATVMAASKMVAHQFRSSSNHPSSP